LFAHGSRDAQWARPFEQLTAIVSRETGARVQLAYLEFMRPGLSEALDSLAGEGVAAIRIVPVFLAVGGHMKYDLPRLVEDARKKHRHLQIDLDRAIGEQEAVLGAIAAAIIGRQLRP